MSDAPDTRLQPKDPASVFRRVGALVIITGIVFVIFFMRRTSPGAEEDFRSVATVEAPEDRRPIPAEMGPFRDLLDGRYALAMSSPSPHVDRPSREVRMTRRAYEGAPPVIPHVLDRDTERDQDCRPCHEFGGYNPSLKTYTPRVPHPELSQCMQCHVRQEATSVYDASSFVAYEAPAYGEGGVVLGSPPTIKHPLQMREHCLACHGGASAAPDIRTSHPERFNCRQCHVPVDPEMADFTRPVTVGGTP
jgi:cytochrome c-type protein NapB